MYSHLIRNYLFFKIITQKYKSLKIAVDFEMCVITDTYFKDKLWLLLQALVTTRPFRYDLNQIPYDDTVEVTNRFKGLDLIDRVPEELWTEVRDIVQEAVIKTISKKKKCKKAKRLSEKALQVSVKREAKGKGERKDIPIWTQSSKE